MLGRTCSSRARSQATDVVQALPLDAMPKLVEMAHAAHRFAGGIPPIHRQRQSENVAGKGLIKAEEERYANVEMALALPVFLMRCGPMTRVAWSALIVLMLEALPTDAFAHSPVCHAIRRGESAAQAARRTTGNERNAYQAWFQIMNASSRFVPKSQYDRIHAGWRACIVPTIRSLSSNANHVEEPEAADVSETPNPRVPKVLAGSTALASADAGDRLQTAASDVFRRLGGVDLTMLWLCAAMVVPWLGWRIVDDYLARRKIASVVVRYFAHRFVDEFERPLVRYDVAESPVRSRLRCGARPRRFDILLAPGEGRRYPNLSDHKKNVEYDVTRVMHVLGDDSFVSGALYTQAEWIVVPFQFTVGPKRSGVRCISSL